MVKFTAKKKKSLVKEFGKAFVEGFREVQQYEWDRAQLMYPPLYRVPKDAKARAFSNETDAKKFTEIIKKKGYKYSKINKEISEFFGVVCSKPQSIFMVYFSKKPLGELKVDDPTRISLVKAKLLSPTPSVCEPKVFKTNLKVIGGGKGV